MPEFHMKKMMKTQLTTLKIFQLYHLFLHQHLKELLILIFKIGYSLKLIMYFLLMRIQNLNLDTEVDSWIERLILMFLSFEEICTNQTLVYLIFLSILKTLTHFTHNLVKNSMPFQFY